MREGMRVMPSPCSFTWYMEVGLHHLSAQYTKGNKGTIQSEAVHCSVLGTLYIQARTPETANQGYHGAKTHDFKRLPNTSVPLVFGQLCAKLIKKLK